MSWLNSDPKVGMNFVSDTLRVTVKSSKWIPLLVGVGVPAGILSIFLPHWNDLSAFVRGGLILGLLADAAGLIYKLLGTEVGEFNEQHLTIYREIHGWERRREYPMKECREMQWDEGSEGVPQGVICRVGSKWIRFGADISEQQANRIFLGLQERLPGVCASVFSFTEEKDSLLQLGLG
jgi:hypothetical protein